MNETLLCTQGISSGYVCDRRVDHEGPHVAAAADMGIRIINAVWTVRPGGATDILSPPSPTYYEAVKAWEARQ